MTECPEVYAERSHFVANVPGLVSFWTFDEPSALVRPRTNTGFPLRAGDAIPSWTEGGVFAEHAPELGNRRWYMAPASDCGLLEQLTGSSRLTIVAWIRRRIRSDAERLSELPGELVPENRHLYLCEQIAGLWNETNYARQFALFMNLRLWGGRDQVCGHISDTGGPTPGSTYCTSASVGNTEVTDANWHMVAFTYDGSTATSWLDGECDEGERNPYYFGKPINGPGLKGSDFTVGAVNRAGVMGNFFQGSIGGLAIFDRDLGPDEMRQLSQRTLSGDQERGPAS